jgi:hypothetical protein
VGAVVPAALAQVHPAEHRDRAVDDHRLLVLAGADRVTGVELEAQVLVAADAEGERLERLALEGEHRRGAPGQDAHLELGPRLAELRQELDQRERFLGLLGLFATQELDAAVELPAQHQDRALGLPAGVVDGAVVVLAVDEEPGARRVGDDGAGAAGREDGLGLCHGRASSSATTGRWSEARRAGARDHTPDDTSRSAPR